MWKLHSTAEEWMKFLKNYPERNLSWGVDATWLFKTTPSLHTCALLIKNMPCPKIPPPWLWSEPAYAQSGSRPYGGSVIDPCAHLPEIYGQIGLDQIFRVSRWAPAKAGVRCSAQGAAAPQTVNMCLVRAGAVLCVYRSRFLACLVTGLGLWPTTLFSDILPTCPARLHYISFLWKIRPRALIADCLRRWLVLQNERKHQNGLIWRNESRPCHVIKWKRLEVIKVLQFSVQLRSNFRTFL